MVEAATRSQIRNSTPEVAVTAEWPIENYSHHWAQEIKQQRGRNAEAKTASQIIAPEEIDQITQNLSCDDCYGQSPPPKAVLEPTGPAIANTAASSRKRIAAGLAEVASCL